MAVLGRMISWGMVISMADCYKENQVLLFVTALIVFVLAIWLIIEGAFAVSRRLKAGSTTQAATGDD